MDFVVDPRIIYTLYLLDVIRHAGVAVVMAS